VSDGSQAKQPRYFKAQQCTFINNLYILLLCYTNISVSWFVIDMTRTFRRGAPPRQREGPSAQQQARERRRTQLVAQRPKSELLLPCEYCPGTEAGVSLFRESKQIC
jgi:hypothetical protein